MPRKKSAKASEDILSEPSEDDWDDYRQGYEIPSRNNENRKTNKKGVRFTDPEERLYSRTYDRGSGPGSWMEVDEGWLQEEAENLLASVVRSNAARDGGIINQLFNIGPTTASKEVHDPLGMGVIDLSLLKLVDEGTSTLKDAEPLVANNWQHGRKSGQLKPQTDGAGPSELQKTRSNLPPELARLMPDEEVFSPEEYLGTFHKGDSIDSLRKGSKALSKELKERTGQLKQLIRENFDRFTSCKSTIDDIYAKLMKVEGLGGSKGTAAASAHAGAGAASSEAVQGAIEGVQATARRTFGGVLDRANKTDRIKSVVNLLQRFDNLFGMPSRIKALAQDRDFDQVVSEFRRANALIRPTPITARVWVSLYQEIEKRVIEVANVARATLEDSSFGAHEDIPDAIIFLAQLSAERLPGTRDENAMALYLDIVERQLQGDLELLDAEHFKRMFSVQDRFAKDGPGRIAALDAALAIDPSLAPAANTSGVATGATANPPGAPSLPSTLRAPSRSTARMPEFVGPPQLPASLEELALLLWPGSGDWQAQRELPPAMAADLRELTLMPRSSLLPEAHLTPAQVSWVTFISDLSDALVMRLPGMWAVAVSRKYAQASDVPEAVAATMSKAPSLARRLVDATLQQYNLRLQVALQALARAGGPLSPLVHLSVQDLCRAWLDLRDVGTTSKALDGVRAGVLGGLALYAAGAQTLLSAMPRMLFDSEDWGLDLAVLDQQPVTALPRSLQEHVVTVMRLFGSLAGHCREVDEGGASASWAPVRDGLFACFAACTACVAGFTADMQARVQGSSQLGGPASSRRNTRGSSTQQAASWGLEDESLHEVDQRVGAEEELLMRPLASGTLESMLKAAGLSVGHALGDSERQEPSGSEFRGAGTGSLQDPTPLAPGISATLQPLEQQDAVHMLLLISNSLWLRTRVFPALVERYHEQLSGASTDGEARCDSALKARTNELRKAAASLLSVYLEHKEGGITQRVTAYVRLVTMPWGSPMKLQGVSEAAFSVVMSMVDVHNEVAAYLPTSLRAVMASLVEHTVNEVVDRVLKLSSHTEPAALLQLHTDIMFMEYVWRRLIPSSLRAEVEEAYEHLRGMLSKALASRKHQRPVPECLKPFVGGARISELLEEAVMSACKAVLIPTIERTTQNVACFTSA